MAHHFDIRSYHENQTDYTEMDRELIDHDDLSAIISALRSVNYNPNTIRALERVFNSIQPGGTCDGCGIELKPGEVCAEHQSEDDE